MEYRDSQALYSTTPLLPHRSYNPLRLTPKPSPLGISMAAFFDREAKEWVSGNNLKLSELTQRRDPRHARGKMHRGSIADHATGGIGERAAYAGLFAQLGDFPYFLMPPIFGIPVLIESTMRSLINVGGIGDGAHRLVRFDFDRRMFFNFPERVELIARHRLLEDFHAVIGQALGKTNRSLGIVSFVGVDLDEYIIADGLAHFGDTGKSRSILPLILSFSASPSSATCLASLAIISGWPTLIILITLISFR